MFEKFSKGSKFFLTKFYFFLEKMAFMRIFFLFSKKFEILTQPLKARNFSLIHF